MPAHLVTNVKAQLQGGLMEEDEEEEEEEEEELEDHESSSKPDGQERDGRVSGAERQGHQNDSGRTFVKPRLTAELKLLTPESHPHNPKPLWIHRQSLLKSVTW